MKSSPSLSELNLYLSAGILILLLRLVENHMFYLPFEQSAADQHGNYLQTDIKNFGVCAKIM